MALANSLLQIAQIVEAAQDLIPALNAVRTEIPDDEWDALIDRHPQLDALLDACADLEHAVEHEPEA